MKVLITLLIALFTLSVLAAQDGAVNDPEKKTADQLFAEGQRLMDEKNYPEALKRYTEALKQSPDGPGSLFNGGLAAYLSGNFKTAADFWERLVVLTPKDWEAHAKLVQAYQALGELDKRDKHRETILKLRQEGLQVSLSALTDYRRDQFFVDGKKVLVFEYFELKGERAILYKFIVLKPGAEIVDFFISLGSYEATDAVAHKLGEIGPKDRLFHLDGYYSDGSHETYGFYKNAPTYEVVKDKVIQILKGNNNLTSSSNSGKAPPKSTPKGKGK